MNRFGMMEQVCSTIEPLALNATGVSVSVDWVGCFGRPLHWGESARLVFIPGLG